MSRIGKTPIQLPQGVTFEQNSGEAVVKGPRGTLVVPISTRIVVTVENNVISLKSLSESKDDKSLHGLSRTLLDNAVVGVTKGWEKTLELVGVGYRAQGGGKELTLSVGFSHPVKVTATDDIQFTIKENKIIVAGSNKKIVGETAASLRKIRPPEPYKGKGIRYLGEVIRKKAGKAVKAAGAA